MPIRCIRFNAKPKVFPARALSLIIVLGSSVPLYLMYVYIRPFGGRQPDKGRGIVCVPTLQLTEFRSLADETKGFDLLYLICGEYRLTMS